MWASKKYMTVIVYNLGEAITKDHVQDFFAKRLRDSEPIVSGLVQKPDKSKTTTVTVKGSDVNRLRETIKSFKKPEFDKHPLNQEAGFSYSFIGLTPLYGSSTEPAAFDVYFVHGLGGHAFNTWASKPDHHANVCMWPRDILPAYLERKRGNEEQLFGRYSTFGYDATMHTGTEMEQSIPETAGVLLNALATSRAGTVPDNTPIFLVCHSLGGLVACQAVVIMLSKKEYRENFEESLMDRFFHSRHGKCLVRGIAFFGTPFEGSKLADLAPLVPPVFGLRSGKGSFISALRVKDQQVQSIIKQFDEVRKEPQNRIRLVIFYEKKAVGKAFIKTMVTEKQSALSNFREKVDQEPLLLDHQNIVKFTHEADRDFQQLVGPLIMNMIRSGLAEMREFDMQYHPPISLGPALDRRVDMGTKIAQLVRSDDEDGTEGLDHEESDISRGLRSKGDANNSPRWMLLKFRRSSDVERVLKVLLEGIPDTDNSAFISKQVAQVKHPIDNTCDWILKQDLYNDWEKGSTHKVLFFMGTEGSGKSVLAKYIINRIASDQTDAVVASFFCRSIGTTTTPANILRHVILQLERQSEDLILKSLFDRPITAFGGGQFDVDVLWLLFRAMCDNIGRKVFVIIDALDECLQNIRLQERDGHASVNPVNRFLEQLCDLMIVADSESSVSGSARHLTASRMAICFLTRPQDQVNSAVEGKNCVISIDPIQVQERAAQVIEFEIERLVTEEKLPPDLEKLVKENLLEKAKKTPQAAFQWANTAVELMQRETGTTAEKLDAIHPGLYAVYTDIITKLSADDQTQRLASLFLQTLVFAEADMDFDMLEHAFHLNKDPQKSEEANSGPQMLIREIADNSRGLVTIDDDVVRLSHESVRRFFLQLSSTEWPRFSCSDHRKGHADMALLCLRYLTLWHRENPDGGKLSEEHELRDALELEEVYLRRAGAIPFMEYALDYWVFHVHESGTLLQDLLPILGYFLRKDAKSYRLAMTLTEYRNGSKLDFSRKPENPAFTLVKGSLFHVLQKVLIIKRVDKMPQRSSTIRTMFRSGSVNKPSTEGTSYFQFQIDVTLRNAHESSLLHVAAENGSLDIVQNLLDQGAAGDVFDLDGATPFSLAVSNGYASIAELLIERGHAVERKYNRDFAASLHMASFYDMRNVVKHLLKAKTDPNITCFKEDWTALHVAAQKGHDRVVEMLLAYHANASLLQLETRTALHFAAANGHTEACRILLANPGPDVDFQDKDGQSAVYKTAANGHADTVRFLLSKGATMVAENIDGYTPVHIAATRGHKSVVDIIANKDNVHDRTFLAHQPIHRAAANGHAQIVKAFVELGADPNAKARDAADVESESLTVPPIALAVETGHQDVVAYLLSIGVQVKEYRRFNNETLLHRAAAGGNLPIAKMLMDQYDLNPFEQSNDNKTPFYIAALEGHIDTVKAFWNSPRRGARSIDIVGPYRYTPLIAAAQKAHKEVAEFCLEHGADPCKVDSVGRSAIALLVDFAGTEKAGEVDILKALINHGGSVDSRDHNGVTPLHKAASSGRDDLLLHLLESGADVNAISDNGSSPLHDAAVGRNFATFSLLLEWKANPLLINDVGYAPVDYVGAYGPILSSPNIQDFLKTYKPLQPEERARRIRTIIVQFLTRHVSLHARQNRTLEELSWSSNLANYLFLLGREEDTRVAVERGVTRRASSYSTLPFNCAKCHKSGQRSPAWLCRDCRPACIPICNSCYRKRDDDDIFRGCSKDHSLMEVGGQYFQELKYGTVRKDGLTIMQWRDNLRKEFGVEKPPSEIDEEEEALQG